MANLKQTPRSVLMTADTIGGVWTYALELASALNARGVSVTLASMGASPTQEQHDEAAGLGDVHLIQSDYKLEWMQDPWADVEEAGNWLLELERSVRPDIVHLNDYAHGALPWNAPKLVVGHSCVCSWWRAVYGCDAPAKWNHYRDAVAAGLLAADSVICPSDAMLAALQEHYGPLSGTRVIPNGRNLTLLSQPVKENFILSAGRLWDPAKNLSTLDSIAAELPWPVYVAGELARPDGESTQSHYVRHLGRLSSHELTSWYSRASVYALPARYEPFGLSILEAALAGCALVLGDIPSLREIWHGAALFVQPEDPLSLQRALTRLIDDPQLCLCLAQAARRVAAQFTPERMAAGYLAVYAELLDKPRSAKSLEVLAA